VSSQKEDYLIFDNLKPFGYIGYKYKMIFKMNPSFYISNLYKLVNQSHENEIINSDLSMDIAIYLNF